MQEKTVIAAEYRGRQPEAGELLLSLRREFQRLVLNQKIELKRDRQRLAERLKTVKRRVSARAQRQGMREAQAELCKHLSEQQEGFHEALHEAKRECVALALSIAEEVLAQAVQADHQSLLDKVNNALAPLSPGAICKILVHPANCNQVAAALPSCTIEAAPGMEPGNVLIKTATGQIEIEWRAHLAQIRTILEQQLASEAKRQC